MKKLQGSKIVSYYSKMRVIKGCKLIKQEIN